MRRLLPALTGCLLALAAGCSSDSRTPTGGQAPGPLSETILGPDGGTWQHEDFILQVPPGQLPAGTTLALYAAEQESAQPAAEVAAVHRIEGIPVGMDRDFPLRLRHGAAGGDSLFVMVGQPGFVPSLGETITRWQMVACTDSAGWALCDLPVAGPAGTTKNTPPLLVTVVDGVATASSAGGRFKIHWQPDQAEQLDIEVLATELENSLDLYEFMGYEWAGFDAWPVDVQVQPMAPYGYWSPDPRHLGGLVAISTSTVGDVIEGPLTTGHELFHFCQYFYDPRSVEERGTTGPDHRWLDEATAVHMEIYFAPSDEYPSAARLGRELELLNGLLTPRDGLTSGEHGYGVSSLIRYLFAQEDGADNFILATYQAIARGTHAVAALQAATTIDIPQRWQTILEELLLGNIYADVTWPVIDAQSRPTLLSVGSAVDTTGTLSGSMNDTGGLLARVELDYADWSDEHRVVLWTEPADLGLSVLGVKPDGSREVLASGTGQVSLTDPAALQESYDEFLVLVASSRFQGPGYDGSRPMTLQGRVRSAPVAYNFPRLSYHLQLDALWDDDATTVNQEINIYNADGSFVDGVFTAVWDSTIDEGAVRFVGEITAVVDPEFSRVSSWTARTAIWHSDDTGYEYEAAGGQVPATNLYPHSFSAWLEGTDTCGALDTVTMTEVDNAGSRSLTGHSCRSSSYVKFFFEDPSAGSAR